MSDSSWPANPCRFPIPIATTDFRSALSVGRLLARSLARATAAGMDTSIFFTYDGLNIITKGFPDKVKVSPVGNPAMPMPIPMADTFTSLPGMKAFATAQMKAKFKKSGVASVGELINVCRDSGVRLIACTMTMEVFGLKESDFIDGVEFGGAGAFLSEARQIGRAHV